MYNWPPGTLFWYIVIIIFSLHWSDPSIIKHTVAHPISEGSTSELSFFLFGNLAEMAPPLVMCANWTWSLRATYLLEGPFTLGTPAFIDCVHVIYKSSQVSNWWRASENSVVVTMVTVKMQVFLVTFNISIMVGFIHIKQKMFQIKISPRCL